MRSAERRMRNAAKSEGVLLRSAFHILNSAFQEISPLPSPLPALPAQGEGVRPSPHRVAVGGVARATSNQPRSVRLSTGRVLWRCFAARHPLRVCAL